MPPPRPTRFRAPQRKGFADYLTASAQRGDYYVGGELEGEGGAWHGSPEALGELGLDPTPGPKDRPRDALMDGRSPRTGEPIRRVGGDGSRVAGIDMTFSAPKSVSALWAVSDPYRRAQIEVAHRRAVASALARIEREVPVVRRREAARCARSRRGVLSRRSSSTPRRA
jgi:conjugative relaxase-like TrwC/TraI family protein